MNKADSQRICAIIFISLYCGGMIAFTLYHSKIHCMTSPAQNVRYSDSECPPNVEEYCPAYGVNFESAISWNGQRFLKAICPWTRFTWIFGTSVLSVVEVYLVLMIILIAKKAKKARRILKTSILCLIMIALLIFFGSMIRDMVIGGKYKQEDIYTNKPSPAFTHVLNVMLVFFFLCALLGSHVEPKPQPQRQGAYNVANVITGNSTTAGNITRNTTRDTEVTPQIAAGPVVSVHYATREDPPNIVLGDGKRYIVTVQEDAS